MMKKIFLVGVICFNMLLAEDTFVCKTDDVYQQYTLGVTKN